MNPAIVAGMSNPAVLAGFVAASVLTYLGLSYLLRTKAQVQPEGSDKETMARMLASETKNKRAKEYIGQITRLRAARAGKSITLLVTNGKGYGKQKRGEVSFYASTDKQATRDDYEAADRIIAGSVVLDPRVDERKVGSWIERKQGSKSLNAQQQDTLILARQHIWGEGIIGVVQDTDWVIFQRGAPAIGRQELAKIANRYKGATTGEEREKAIIEGSSVEDIAALNDAPRLV